MGGSRLVLAGLACSVLAACASLEGRLRDRSAAADDIEAGFASEQAAIRCLAAESCTWQEQEGCEARLEAMVQNNPSPEVRLCVLRTLGALCSTEAREALLRLHSFFLAEETAAFMEVAAACPSADLHLALALGAGHLPRGLAPPPTHLEAQVRWLQQIAALPVPRYRAGQARDRAEKKLTFERAETLRAREIQALRAQAEAALAADRWRDADETSRTLVLLGEPVGDLLRRIAQQRLQEQKMRFEAKLQARNFKDAFAAIDKHLYLLDPGILDRYTRERYYALLPEAKEVQRLAKQGKTAAAQRKLDDLPIWENHPHPLNDLIRLQVDAIADTLVAGSFDKAWSEAWLLRATRSPANPIFLDLYAHGRWEAEGFQMNRQQFDAYMKQVGEHAPPEAAAQAKRFELEDEALAGDMNAALMLYLAYAHLLDDHVNMCAGRNTNRIPEPLADKPIEMVADLMEYFALDSTTVRARTQFRAKRDEGRRLAREVETQRKSSPAIKAKGRECAEKAQRMRQFEGARPGSEAFDLLRQRSRATVSCLTDYWKLARPILRQGQRCLDYIRGAHSLGVRLVDE